MLARIHLLWTRFHRRLDAKSKGGEAGAAPTAILFVCMANVCRSPMALGVARRLAAERGIAARFRFDSAGVSSAHLGEAADARARAVGERWGEPLAGHRARRITQGDFARFDRILAMDAAVLSVLRRWCPPEHQGRLGLFLETLAGECGGEVSDPYYGSVDAFERVHQQCDAALSAYFSRGETATASGQG